MIRRARRAAGMLVLAAGLLTGVSLAAPLNGGGNHAVVAAVGGALRAVPPCWKSEIGRFLESPAYDPLALSRALRALPAPVEPGGPARLAAEADAALGLQAAPEFARKVFDRGVETNGLEVAEKLRMLDAVLALYLPPERREDLTRAAAQAQEAIGAARQSRLDERMRGIAGALGRRMDLEPLAEGVAGRETGAVADEKAWRLQPRPPGAAAARLSPLPSPRAGAAPRPPDSGVSRGGLAAASLLAGLAALAWLDIGVVENYILRLHRDYGIPMADFSVNILGREVLVWWLYFIPGGAALLLLIGAAAARWRGAVAGVLLFATGAEDVLYYLLQGRPLPAELPWLDLNPAIFALSRIVGAGHVSDRGLLVSVIVGLLASLWLLRPQARGR